MEMMLDLKIIIIRKEGIFLELHHYVYNASMYMQDWK